MPIDLFMPALSPTMTHGSLAKWLVKEGDTVRSGTILAEIETDKATLEFEAIDEGVIGALLVSEGAEDVAVNARIAVLLEDGETQADLQAYLAAGGEQVVSSEASGAADAPTPTDHSEPQPSSAPTHGSSTDDGQGTSHSESTRTKASPLARRIAKQNGLDLQRLAGSGPRGRVVQRDVIQALQAHSAGSAASSTPSQPHAPAANVGGGAQSKAVSSQPSPAGSEGAYTVQPMDRMRRVIAQRLQESKQTIPHFYVTRDIDLEALVALRKEINGFGDRSLVKVSINDMVIKAWAMALQRVPAANVSVAGNDMLLHHRVDVSVAVAIEGGLVTPIIFDAASIDLYDIALAMRALVPRAKERKLKPEEYTGGTTSLSNLGMFGVREFAAILSPPQATILAVGAGEPRPAVVDGVIVPRVQMTATLSCDHRVVDGALGAQVLGEFHDLLTQPLQLLLPVGSKGAGQEATPVSPSAGS